MGDAWQQQRMDSAAIRRACGEAAIAMGRAIRTAVAAMPPAARADRLPCLLKPHPEVAARPDVVGEEVALEHLKALAQQLGLAIRLVIDTTSGRYAEVATDPSGAMSISIHQGGQESSVPQASPAARHIWCYLDAVDGTIKLSGLGSKPGRLRTVNDGTWGVGVAFTDATTASLSALAVEDIKVAAIVDGNPPTVKAHPTDVVAFWESEEGGASNRSSNGGAYATYEWLGPAAEAGSSADGGGAGANAAAGCLVRLYTSSSGELGQCMAYMDTFQAYDQRTAASSDPALAAALHAALCDRNHGGAFDVLRTYGNLAALLRTMLGWRGPMPVAARAAGAPEVAAAGGASPEPDAEERTWLEAQCGAYVCINENLPNLLPAVPIVLGAGGMATDLAGAPLTARALAAGRTSVLYTANAGLHAAVMALVNKLGGA